MKMASLWFLEVYKNLSYGVTLSFIEDGKFLCHLHLGDEQNALDNTLNVRDRMFRKGYSNS